MKDKEYVDKYVLIKQYKGTTFLAGVANSRHLSLPVTCSTYFVITPIDHNETKRLSVNL